MNNKPVRVRIAPSPTGDAHVGHARTALYDYLFARQKGGVFVLRIDDTDTARNTLDSEEGVIRGLKWLGLNWDEGPDVGGSFAPYRQSERSDTYHKHADLLLQEGKAYHCYCSSEELEAERKAQTDAKEDPRYSGKCRMLSPEERQAQLDADRVPTVRLKVPGGVVGFTDLVRGWIEWDTALMGDFIILKSSGIPVYNFATVIDDHLMDISHVTRGAEHIANTFSQILIYQALGWELPEFAHFSIMLNEDRTKMSKRKGATFIGQYADMGYLPEAMINFLAFLGWSPGTTDDEIYTLDQLTEEFSLERCTASNAVFDIKKLDWINAKWIRRLMPADVAERIVPFLQRVGMVGDKPDMAQLEKIAVLIQERLHRLDDAPALCSFFLSDPEVPAEELKEALAQVDGKAGLAEVVRVLTTVDWQEATIEENLRALQKELGWNTKTYFMSLRLAILGNKVSPPLFGSIEVIGRDGTIARINRAIDSI